MAVSTFKIWNSFVELEFRNTHSKKNETAYTKIILNESYRIWVIAAANVRKLHLNVSGECNATKSQAKWIMIRLVNVHFRREKEIFEHIAWVAYHNQCYISNQSVSNYKILKRFEYIYYLYIQKHTCWKAIFSVLAHRRTWKKWNDKNIRSKKELEKNDKHGYLNRIIRNEDRQFQLIHFFKCWTNVCVQIEKNDIVRRFDIYIKNQKEKIPYSLSKRASERASKQWTHSRWRYILCEKIGKSVLV